MPSRNSSKSDDPIKARGPGDLRAWVANRLIVVFLWFLRLIPYPSRIRLGGWFFSAVLAPLSGHRARIRANLRKVCPDLPSAEIRRLEKSVPNNVGRTIIELFSPHDFSAVARQAPVSGPGLSVLEEARAAGRPAILVSGHFGNYDVVRAGLIARGFNIGALYRRMNNRFFNEIYVATISRIGTPLFERGRPGMADMVRFLNEGGALALLIDQHMQQGEPLEFFGQTAYTAVSAAKMALKYDAPLIPFYVTRQQDGLHFTLELEAPIPPSDPATMTQALNDSLEARVRDNMDQWLWVHRRWKTPPRK